MNKINCLFLFTRNWIKQEWEGLNHILTGTLFNFPLEVQKYKAKKKMEERKKYPKPKVVLYCLGKKTNCRKTRRSRFHRFSLCSF